MPPIDVIGRLVDRIMNQTNARTFDKTTDSLEAIGTGIILIIAILGQLGNPEIQHYEGWQDELGIDFTLWDVTNPATGAAWARGAGAGVAAPFLVASAAPAANETARLVSTVRWPIAPDTWDVNTIIRRTILEFEMTIANLANLDNAICIFGLTPGQADTRATNNIVGFALIGAGNALQTVTDVGGVEEVNTGFGEDLALYNKFRIDVLHDGEIEFYLNEALIATHVVSLPDLPMFIDWFFDTDGGGAATPQIGINRLWTEDYERP